MKHVKHINQAAFGVPLGFSLAFLQSLFKGLLRKFSPKIFFDRLVALFRDSPVTPAADSPNLFLNLFTALLRTFDDPLASLNCRRDL